MEGNGEAVAEGMFEVAVGILGLLLGEGVVDIVALLCEVPLNYSSESVGRRDLIPVS